MANEREGSSGERSVLTCKRGGRRGRLHFQPGFWVYTGVFILGFIHILCKQKEVSGKLQNDCIVIMEAKES